jgi:hypothetical protein
MTEEVKPNPSEATTHDAQLAAENMASGEEEVQKVDLDADYEASKAFSVSEVDRKGGGAEAAEAATAPNFKVPEATEMKSSPDTTGNPADYIQMAQEVSPRKDG